MYIVEFTPEQIERLIEGYASPFVSIRELATEFGIAKDTVMRKANELCLQKVRKTNLSPAQWKAIHQWDGTVSITKLADDIGLSMEAVRKRLKQAGYDTKAYFKVNPTYMPSKTPNTDEFFSDLDNPRYSGADLSEKYGVSDVAIQRRRKRRHGKFKLQLNTAERLTTPEKRVKEILDALDMTYFVHYVIEGWNVDFYLGAKKAIEVNGNFWHDSDSVKEKDNRKITQLQSSGYDVLVINEDDLHDPQSVKDRINRFRVTLISNGK